MKTFILIFSRGERFDKTITTRLSSGQFAIGVCFKEQANLAITKDFNLHKGMAHKSGHRETKFNTKEKKKCLPLL